MGILNRVMKSMAFELPASLSSCGGFSPSIESFLDRINLSALVMNGQKSCASTSSESLLYFGFRVSQSLDGCLLPSHRHGGCSMWNNYGNMRLNKPLLWILASTRINCFFVRNWMLVLAIISSPLLLSGDPHRLWSRLKKRLLRLQFVFLSLAVADISKRSSSKPLWSRLPNSNLVSLFR